MMLTAVRAEAELAQTLLKLPKIHRVWSLSGQYSFIYGVKALN